MSEASAASAASAVRPDDRLPKTVARAAAAVTLVVSGGYAISLGDTIRYWDEQTYVDLARNLAAGHGYTQFNTGPTAYRPPGYPLILGALHRIGLGVLEYRLLNTLIFAATVYLVYLLARRIYSAKAGAVAAVLTAGYPLFLYTAGTLYPQMLAACLLVSGLLAVSHLTEPNGPALRTAALAGLMWGLLIITVPTFGAVVTAVCVWLIHRLRFRAVRPLAVLLLCAAVLPTGWCIRNAIEMHAFIPISTNNGINLLQGNSAKATAGGGRLVDTSQYEAPAERAGLNEVQVDDLYRSEAIHWIMSHPGRAAVLYVEKVTNNFNYHNDYATAGRSSVAKDVVSAFSFYPLLLLLLVRVADRKRRADPIELLLVTLVFTNAFALAVFYTRLRFRIPMDTLVIVVAAGALVQLWSAWRSPQAGRRTAARTTAPE